MYAEGFLGTGAPLSRDITLLLYILLLAPAMITGFIFARRKMFTPYHKFTMTGITIFNWILIVIIMMVSYRFMTTDADGLSLSTPVELLATLHLITGAAAQLLATYLVIMMWTERTPLARLVPFRFKNIKLPMRLTLTLWLITVVLGIGIYLVSYTGSANTSEITPVVTEEAIEPAATEPASGGGNTAPASTEAPDPAATEDADDDDDDDDDDDN